MTKKVKQKNFLNPTGLVKQVDLGRTVAEQDDNLADYYVEPNRYVVRAENFNDPATFFVGPKGIGKSAILQMVRIRHAPDQSRIINITPDDLAFAALANVNVNSPLLADPGKQQWLFKSLWDYVLSLEILKREYRGGLGEFFRTLFGGRYEKEAALLLKLSAAEGGAPQSLSMRVIQLIEEVEIAGDVPGAKISGKAKLNHKPAASMGHIQLLNLVNTVAKDVADKISNSYYILIDDLDLYWTNTPTQNAFIAALFNSLRHLHRPPRLKCVVALRDNIFREVPVQDRDKFHDWICRVHWDSASVKSMIAQRVYRTLHCQAHEIWGGVFPANGFDQIWKFTSGRPRDAIRLAGLCIEEARELDHLAVDDGDITSAIRVFSEQKISELASENNYKLPGLDHLVGRFHGWPKQFPMQKFKADFLDLALIELACQEGSALRFDWIRSFEQSPQSLVQVLMECGVLWFKSSRTAHADPYNAERPQPFTDATWLAVNPLFGPALGLIGD